MTEPTRSSALRRVYVPFVTVAAVVIALDQLTKWWAVHRLSSGEVIEVIGPVRFQLAYNTGMAFSQGASRGAIIAAVGVGIVVFLAVFAHRTQSRGAILLMGMVAGGALGNIGDRLFRSAGKGFLGGGVVDFIRAVPWWPIFNIADSAVVVGGLMLAIWIYREGPTDKDALPDVATTPGAPVTTDNTRTDTETDADIDADIDG